MANADAAGAAAGPGRTARYDGLPLHRLPAHDRQRVFPEFALPQERPQVTAGKPVAGGLHGAAQHMFCPHCMSWHFTRPKGMDVFVDVRATMLDNARAFSPFIGTSTVEMLPWARTPAVHRFERFPPAEASPSMLAQFAQQSSAAVGSGRTE